MSTFADNLRDLRTSRNITQEELAHATFMSRSMIAKYESGKVFPNDKNVETLAAYFGVSKSFLLNKEDCVQIPVKEMRLRKRLWLVIFSAGILVDSLYAILCWIPMFGSRHYEYPIPNGATQPESYYVFDSIISKLNEFNNWSGIVTFCLCIADVILLLLAFFIKDKRASFSLRIISVILLCVNIVMICVVLFTFAHYESYVW